MSMIDVIIGKAQERPQRILLPEAEDDRMLQAAAELESKAIARVTLLGDRRRIHERQKELGIKHDVHIVEPQRAGWTDSFAGHFLEMRRHKGMTLAEAQELMREPIHHAMMMLHHNMGDGLVAGACHSTGETLRPALQILKTAPGAKLVSSFFFMTWPDRTLLFADCALVEDPDSEQLAEIALSTAASAKAFDLEPRVAMLSYSTKGSADGPSTRKVAEAVRIANSRLDERFGKGHDVAIDGELQADAALVQEVAKKKCPHSAVAGGAQALIFPDLNAGNIGYKLVERLGGAKAYGPVLQGLRMPVNDLSRGCSVDDIVGVAAITAVQSQMRSRNEAVHCGAMAMS